MNIYALFYRQIRGPMGIRKQGGGGAYGVSEKSSPTPNSTPGAEAMKEAA